MSLFGNLTILLRYVLAYSPDATQIAAQLKDVIDASAPNLNQPKRVKCDDGYAIHPGGTTPHVWRCLFVRVFADFLLAFLCHLLTDCCSSSQACPDHHPMCTVSHHIVVSACLATATRTTRRIHANGHTMDTANIRLDS